MSTPSEVLVHDGVAVAQAAPTAATDGIPLRTDFQRVHLFGRLAVSAGTPTFQLKVYKYQPADTQAEWNSTTGKWDAVTFTGAWDLIFDTTLQTGSGTQFNLSWLLYGATDSSRLAIEVVGTPGGTSPSLDAGFQFSTGDNQ